MAAAMVAETQHPCFIAATLSGPVGVQPGIHGARFAPSVARAHAELAVAATSAGAGPVLIAILAIISIIAIIVFAIARLLRIVWLAHLDPGRLPPDPVGTTTSTGSLP